MIQLNSLCAVLLVACAAQAQAKLPALSPEAKATADEAKAKGAHGDKVAAYKLCLSMDRTAAYYLKTAGKDGKSVTATPPCADPGAFVYTPEAGVVVATPAAAAAASGSAAKPTLPPLEAAGAHSPTETAKAPFSGKETTAEQTGTVKK